MKEIKSKDLDQFYTNPKVSDEVVNKTIDIFKRNNININELKFIEPSAGTGNFIKSLEKYINSKKIKAYDIDPKSNQIEKKDFLKLKIRKDKNNVIIGNPPFGKRSKIALEFVNKSFEVADIICFILPRQFNRFLTQKKVDNNLKLIYSENLNEDSFLVNNSSYNVNSVYQIWVNKKNKFFENEIDKRIISEIKKHDDFDTFIHNNTKKTRVYFDKKQYKWTIALHRQGYYEYKDIIKEQNNLINNRQYFFVKSNIENRKFLRIVNNIDFDELISNNTTVPGFSTSDFIREYNKSKENLKI